MAPRIVLASSSKYRRSLLDRLQLDYSCQSPNIDESPQEGESPTALCQRLARQKAQAIADTCDHHWIIGSDQVAALGNKLLGKPGNMANAMEQLSACSGNSLSFHTAVCLLDTATGNSQTAMDTTTVRFRQLAGAEIETYLKAEQPFDCAGSFKVEGLGISLFEEVNSRDPSALMGLPLIALTSMLKSWGFSLPLGPAGSSV